METFTQSFPNPFKDGMYGVGDLPKTTDELDIIQLSAKIREKPDWQIKVKDPQILSKWKKEILEQSVELSERKKKVMSFEDVQMQKKLDYVLKELEYYLSLRSNEEQGTLEVGAIDGTWQSDNLIPSDTSKKLLDSVKKLEDVPEEDKDWHPGTNQQVLDLVHPSLYCFVSEVTRVLKQQLRWPEGSQINHLNAFLQECASMPEDAYISREETFQKAFHHTQGFPSYSSSKKYQWLPTEFAWNESLKKFQIASYINNLHPTQHPELYSEIESIFQRFVPLFNRVLTELRHPRENRLKPLDSSWYEGGYFEGKGQQEMIPLEIPPFKAPESFPTKVQLEGRNLQVIVKLASIHLTPENPSYPGGVWHVEGMVNERIVSSGIYYYASDNISESRLMFRQAVQEPGYEQYDVEGVEVVYGLRDEEPLNQVLGYIVTKEGRCIAFPNTLQHQVAPFELVDKTRSGCRKILVFFLVDPSVKVISTAVVPPQQKEWYEQELSSPQLSPEAKSSLQKFLENPSAKGLMTLCEAKQHRDELMKERKFFFKENNDQYFERSFSLCEH